MFIIYVKNKIYSFKAIFAIFLTGLFDATTESSACSSRDNHNLLRANQNDTTSILQKVGIMGDVFNKLISEKEEVVKPIFNEITSLKFSNPKIIVVQNLLKKDPDTIEKVIKSISNFPHDGFIDLLIDKCKDAQDQINELNEALSKYKDVQDQINELNKTLPECCSLNILLVPSCSEDPTIRSSNEPHLVADETLDNLINKAFEKLTSEFEAAKKKYEEIPLRMRVLISDYLVGKDIKENNFSYDKSKKELTNNLLDFSKQYSDTKVVKFIKSVCIRGQLPKTTDLSHLSDSVIETIVKTVQQYVDNLAKIDREKSILDSHNSRFNNSSSIPFFNHYFEIYRCFEESQKKLKEHEYLVADYRKAYRKCCRKISSEEHHLIRDFIEQCFKMFIFDKYQKQYASYIEEEKKILQNLKLNLESIKEINSDSKIIALKKFIEYDTDKKNFYKHKVNYDSYLAEEKKILRALNFSIERIESIDPKIINFKECFKEFLEQGESGIERIRQAILDLDDSSVPNYPFSVFIEKHKKNHKKIVDCKGNLDAAREIYVKSSESINPILDDLSVYSTLSPIIDEYKENYKKIADSKRRGIIIYKAYLESINPILDNFYYNEHNHSYLKSLKYAIKILVKKYSTV